LKSGKTLQAAYLFKNFITNPYIGMSLSGPSNPNACKLAVYKPSNPQFAVQGAVSSSARTLKLTVATIRTAIGDSRSGSNNVILNFGKPGNVPYIYKSKVQKCTPALPLIFRGLGVHSPLYNPATCAVGPAKGVVAIKQNLQAGGAYVDNSPAIF
jgi:hypothetical protein